jgi:hypothetical protein
MYDWVFNASGSTAPQIQQGSLSSTESSNENSSISVSIVGILPSYDIAGSTVSQYLFCLFLCTAAPPASRSIYIFINTTVTFIGTSGHSVQMSRILASTHIFIFSLEIADIFILP